MEFRRNNQARKGGRLDIQRSHNAAALGQPIQVPAQGGEQTDFIQQWRVQKVRQASYLLNGTIDCFAGISGYTPVSLDRILFKDSVHHHFSGSKVLA